MAVSREQAKCLKCGESYKATQITKDKNFIGDNFQGWDYSGHKCKDVELIHIGCSRISIGGCTCGYMYPEASLCKYLITKEVHRPQVIEYSYKPVPIAERVPELAHYVNDRLILLDDYYDVVKVISVGILTDWELIKGNAEYWLEKTEINTHDAN